MRLYNDIKKAVIKGINEAFDIEDMDIRINDTPNTKKGIVKHSKLYDYLLDMVDECHKKGIELDFIDNDGKSVKTTENVSDIRFVRFSNDMLKKPEFGNAEDNSIVISVRWKEYFDKLNDIGAKEEGQKWQITKHKLPSFVDYYKEYGITDAEPQSYKNFSGHRNCSAAISDITNMGFNAKRHLPAIAKTCNIKEKLNRKVVHAYLPSIGQMKFMLDNIKLINDTLCLLGVECIEFGNNSNKIWWSSSEVEKTGAWILYKSSAFNGCKTSKNYVLPLFYLND